MQKIIEIFKNKWKIIVVLAIVLILLGIYSLKTQAKNKVELTFKLPVIQSITKTLDVSGHIDAKERVRLRFIAGGKTTYIGVDEGDWVNKWQTIATIDKATLDKQIQKDLNNYMKERWNWEETRDGIKDRSIDQTERRGVDQEQWDLTNTVLDVEVRDIAIQNTSIYSPIEGILTHSPTAVAGMQLLSTDYFEIIDPTSLVFRAAVDESDISLVNEEQIATLILDSFPNDEITTNVNYVSYTSAETSSGTSFIVEFPLKESVDNKILRIGMNGDINIILASKEDVLTIPLIATRTRETKTYVDVKTGENEFEEREISLGLESDELVEVIDGLSKSDEVLIPE